MLKYMHMYEGREKTYGGGLLDSSSSTKERFRLPRDDPSAITSACCDVRLSSGMCERGGEGQ